MKQLKALILAAATLIMAQAHAATDADAEKIRTVQDAIDYINNNIAGFQSNHYKYVKAKLNKIGIKTVPLEEGETLWS